MCCLTFMFFLCVDVYALRIACCVSCMLCIELGVRFVLCVS